MSFIHIIAIVIGCISLVMSTFLVFRFRWHRGGPFFWILKSFSCALSPYISVVAAVCAIAGMVTGSLAAVLINGISVFTCVVYLAGIAVMPSRFTGFTHAFGEKWKEQVKRKAGFLRRPASLRLPRAGECIYRQNIPFAVVPENNRELLCDLWLPPKRVVPTGVAFIYLHGAAWYYLDKDAGTRTFFHHLASQGHVIMDVAYRLFPETDMTGMVQDVKRAIAWMKANAAGCHVDPAKIIIGGGSSGAHLALLAAYLPHAERVNPPELKGEDMGVKGVISLYGPADLEAQYFHLGQQYTTRPGMKKKKKVEREPVWMKKVMGNNYYRFGFNKPGTDTAFVSILGYHPEENPEIYAFFSPLTHVNRHCPPTLIMQGEHDQFTPVSAARELYHKLTEAGVPAVMHILPQTDHAFDLFLPKVSPVAHTAYYMVERFLALMEGKGDEVYNKIRYSTGNGTIKKSVEQV
jgi:acetyl esterase/lipase